MEYTYELRIPKDRVAVLIGIKGENKKRLEEETHCRLDIDSKEGDVIITGEDTISMLSAREIIKAIGRGFNPDIAFLLLKSNYMFEMLNIHDYAGKSKKNELRMKGRVIGAEGKSRKVIEDLTEVNISVYGKTIGLIGEPERISVARKAIESILGGSPHSNVYAWLEKQQKLLKQREML